MEICYTKAMLFIGDIHGEVDWYMARIENEPASIQLGDFGHGFVQFPERPNTHKFIRGNHDDPTLCRNDRRYMGDYGFDDATGIFYISGGFSIDRDYRTENVDWWRDEELNYTDLMACIELYNEKRPEIVVSHECPAHIVMMLHGAHSWFAPSRTANALDTMWRNHPPKTWLFGHHHKNYDSVVLGTRFICVASCDTINIDI